MINNNGLKKVMFETVQSKPNTLAVLSNIRINKSTVMTIPITLPLVMFIPQFGVWQLSKARWLRYPCTQSQKSLVAFSYKSPCLKIYAEYTIFFDIIQYYCYLIGISHILNTFYLLKLHIKRKQGTKLHLAFWEDILM